MHRDKNALGVNRGEMGRSLVTTGRMATLGPSAKKSHRGTHLNPTSVRSFNANVLIQVIESTVSTCINVLTLVKGKRYRRSLGY